jgi:hypothetical protein
MSSPNAQAAQGGDTEPQAEALFDCKGWTIEVTSLYARGVDLTKKMTGVAKKFGLDQHMKELREIDKELQAANKINLQPEFLRLARTKTRIKRPKHLIPTDCYVTLERFPIDLIQRWPIHCRHPRA